MAVDKKIGFIGLGIMGMPMARNLLKAGFEVVAFNRTRSKAEALAKEGAKAASSPREVAAECSVIITIVSDSPDVHQVIMEKDGVIEGVKAGSVVIDMSTISPKVTREIAAALKEKKVQMLDAPVSGGDQGAIKGTLAIMVGGEDDAFERCKPVFDAMGKTIVHVGPNSMGQTVKLMNQILVVNNMMAVAESLVFAAAAGADLATALSVVSGGAAGSWQLSNLGPKVIKGDFAPGFMVCLQQKDLRLALEAAREMNVPLPATSLINNMFRSLEAAGEEREGTQALAKVLERLSGVEARQK